MEIKIEQAHIDDAALILDLQKRAFYSEAVLHNNFDIPPLRQTLESIQEDFKLYAFYKVLYEDTMIGAAKVRLKDDGLLWIGRVVIDPGFQRMGVGSRLMLHIENSFADSVGFELFTAEKSMHNILFYQQLGYNVTGRYTEEDHDDIVMVRMEKLNAPLED